MKPLELTEADETERTQIGPLGREQMTAIRPTRYLARVVASEIAVAKAKHQRDCAANARAWAILCLGVGLTIPFRGIAYLVFGKVRRPRLA